MSELLEKDIERYFLKRMKDFFPEVQVRKYEAQRAEPDRICLFPGGKVAFIELKRPGKRPRPDQVRAMSRLTELGFHANWLSSKGEVDDWIRNILLWGL